MKHPLGFEYELDHIGIACETLDQGFAFYKALGFSEMKVEEVPSQKVRVGFVQLKNHAKIELLEPTSDDSPIRKFLQKRGPGIQQMCLRVKGLDQILEHLKSQGVRLIDEVAKPGAGGCRIAFVHPASAGGVLIELSEKTGTTTEGHR
jgi:methylmalonyl-CoA epimerase